MIWEQTLSKTLGYVWWKRTSNTVHFPSLERGEWEMKMRKDEYKRLLNKVSCLRVSSPIGKDVKMNRFSKRDIATIENILKSVLDDNLSIVNIK